MNQTLRVAVFAAALFSLGCTMASFPGDDDYTTGTPSQGTHRQALKDHLLATKQLPGAAGIEDVAENTDVRIAAGSITPKRGFVETDTEGSAASDDLDNIVTTNLPDGSVLYLKIADNGRVVTVRHLQTGAGQISLAQGVDFEMNRVGQLLALVRRGADWEEMWRAGREKLHIVGAVGEPAFTNSWIDSSLTNAEVAFIKDPDGYVQLRGRAQRNPIQTGSPSIWTLPVGYRPLASRIFPVHCNTSVDGTVSEEIQIGSDGTVNFTNVNSVTGNGTVHLDPVRFLAEQ